MAMYNLDHDSYRDQHVRAAAQWQLVREAEAYQRDLDAASGREPVRWSLRSILRALNGRRDTTFDARQRHAPHSSRTLSTRFR